MDDQLLVEALRARDPGAPAAVYDTYAEPLYAYCWMRLREQDAARAAVRDAFVVAEAQIERLGDPGLLAPWLYAITRLECDRRGADQERAPDLPVASHDQDDVDERVLAWRAVAALPPSHRELLDLHVRHELTTDAIARVTRTLPRQVEEELEFAALELETALTAEILADQGPFGCPERATLLRARRGDLTPLLREELALHAGQCEECAAFKPRTVSAAKVFRLLPWAPLPDDLRERVLDSFLDAELVGYRLFIATRITDYTAEGFPIWPQRSALARRVTWRRRTSHSASLPPDADETKTDELAVLETDEDHAAKSNKARPEWRSLKFMAAAVAALVLLFGASLAAFLALTGRVDGTHGIAGGAGARPTMQPSNGLNGAGALDDTGHNDATPVSATYPLGATGSAAPPTALPSPPAPAREYQPGGDQSPDGPNSALSASPLYLDLADGSDGQIQLYAGNEPVSWRARVNGPVRLSASSGNLAPGQSTTIDVHVSRAPSDQGEAVIEFVPGGPCVHVTWRSAPSSPPGQGQGPGTPPTGPPPTGPGSSTPPSTPPSSPPSTPPSEPPSTTTPPPSTSTPPTTPPSSPPPSSPSPPPSSPSTSSEPPPPQTSSSRSIPAETDSSSPPVTGR